MTRLLYAPSILSSWFSRRNRSLKQNRRPARRAKPLLPDPLAILRRLSNQVSLLPDSPRLPWRRRQGCHLYLNSPSGPRA